MNKGRGLSFPPWPPKGHLARRKRRSGLFGGKSAIERPSSSSTLPARWYLPPGSRETPSPHGPPGGTSQGASATIGTSRRQIRNRALFVLVNAAPNAQAIRDGPSKAKPASAEARHESPPSPTHWHERSKPEVLVRGEPPAAARSTGTGTTTKVQADEPVRSAVASLPPKSKPTSDGATGGSPRTRTGPLQTNPHSHTLKYTPPNPIPAYHPPPAQTSRRSIGVRRARNRLPLQETTRRRFHR